MFEALGAGLLAGLLSAPHCLGMCGPLAAFAAMPREGATPSSTRPLRWQLGRALAYMTLGGIAGGVGGGMLEMIAPSFTSAALSVALAAALVLAAFRIARDPERSAALRLSPLRAKRPKPTWASRIFAHAPRDPFVLGVLTAFLPCGALLSGVMIAASAGSSVRGVLVMFGFASASGLALAVAGAIGSRGLHGAPLGTRRLIAGVLVIGALVTVLRPVAAFRSERDGGVMCHVDRER